MRDLERWIAALWADKVKALSPSAKDIIAGMGQAFDPAPREYRNILIDSDIEACRADLEALYLDWCAVHNQLRDMTPAHVLRETYHFHGRPVRGIETRGRRASTQEREHA